MYSVIFISTKSRRSNLTILNVEGEQTVVCAPIIYLTVNAVGDLTNVPTEWVQISGTPSVDIEVVDELNAYYMVDGNVGSDKVFRFYINRNTQIEQYVDITIRTTPASLMGFIEHGVIANTTTHPLLLTTPFNIQGDIPMDIIPFNSIGGLVTDHVSINWNLPLVFSEVDNQYRRIYTEGFAGSILEERVGSNWVLLGEFAPTEPRSFIITSDKRIRLTSIYSVGGKDDLLIHNQWEDVSVAANNIIKGKEVLASLEHGVVNNNISINRIVYVLDIRNYSDTVHQLEHGVISSDTAINRIVFLLDPRQFIEDAAQLEHGVIANKVTITRISGGVIGG